ncbi:unnamed protein product, partial [Ixodes persulcatus]
MSGNTRGCCFLPCSDSELPQDSVCGRSGRHCTSLQTPSAERSGRRKRRPGRNLAGSAPRICCRRSGPPSPTC